MDRWFVKKEGLVLGPYTVEELKGYVGRGKVSERDLVSTHEESGWMPLAQVPSFCDVMPTQGAVPSLAPDASKASPRAWYVARGSQVVGPLNLDALRAALAQGQMRLDDRACEVGATAWGSVADVDVLRDLLPPSFAPHSPRAGVLAHAPAAAFLPPLDAPVIAEPAVRTTAPPPNAESVDATEPKATSMQRGGPLVVIAVATALLLIVVVVALRQLRAGAPPAPIVGNLRSADSGATAARTSSATPVLADAAREMDPASVPYLVTGSIEMHEGGQAVGGRLLAGKPVPHQDWPLTNCEIRIGLPIRARTDVVFTVPRISMVTHELLFEQACRECGCDNTDRCTPRLNACLAARGHLLCFDTRPRTARPGGYIVRCNEGTVTGLLQMENAATSESLAVTAIPFEGCFPVGAVFPSGEVCGNPMTFEPAASTDAP